MKSHRFSVSIFFASFGSGIGCSCQRLIGDVAGAAALNQRLQPVWTGLFRNQGVILTKAALALRGFPVGGVRLPLVEATSDEIAQLRTDLKDHL